MEHLGKCKRCVEPYQLGLSIMAVTEHNCMRRHDSRDMYMISLLTHYSELAGAYGKMDGVKSLCAGSVLKSGVW